MWPSPTDWWGRACRVVGSLPCVTYTESAEASLDARIELLVDLLRTFGRVVVAFSGGADSAFLAAMAHQALGPDAHAVTAVSPSLAGDEEADCRALAAEWGRFNINVNCISPSYVLSPMHASTPTVAVSYTHLTLPTKRIV